MSFLGSAIAGPAGAIAQLLGLGSGEHLLTTPHFWITYPEGDADAQARAVAIAGSCEGDLKKLNEIFSCDFGASNRYATIVRVNAASDRGASNGGWERDQSSVISIDSSFRPAIPMANAGYIRDEFGRFMFVAELAEIFMDFTGYGWNRAGSNGEALSIVLGTELHPDGYYLSGRGPRIQAWLASHPRPDFVSETEGTDTNKVSYGCGIVFINYLRYQLGFDLRTIVTRPNCPTLADTFNALEPVGQQFAFPGFDRLVLERFPPAVPVTVTRDNFFPLLEPTRRSIHLRVDSMQVSSAPRSRGIVGPPPKVVVLKPGPLCPETRYEYSLLDQVTELDAVATCRGFGNASIRWEINGVPLPTHGSQAAAEIPASLIEPVPYQEGTPVAKTSTTIQYIIRDGWNVSSLQVRNQETVGNCEVRITAIATEPALRDGDTTATESLGLEEVSYELDPAFSRDRRRCNPVFAELGHSLRDLSEKLRLLGSVPDPPPEEHVARVLTVSMRVQERIQATARAIGASTEQVLRDLAAPSEVQALMTLAANLPGAEPSVTQALGLSPSEPNGAGHSSDLDQ